VRQSGNEPAKSGRISKRGSASARWVLVEAAWSLTRPRYHAGSRRRRPRLAEDRAKSRRSTAARPKPGPQKPI
jgi:transposase